MSPSLAKIYSAKKVVIGERKMKAEQMRQLGEFLERDTREMGRRVMEETRENVKGLLVMRERVNVVLEGRLESKREVERLKDEVFEVKTFVSTSILTNRAFMMTNDPEIREVKGELKSLKAMFLSKNNFPAIPPPPTSRLSSTTSLSPSSSPALIPSPSQSSSQLAGEIPTSPADVSQTSPSSSSTSSSTEAAAAAVSSTNPAPADLGVKGGGDNDGQ